MRRNVRRWFGDRGAAAVEYAVLLALIAVVCIGALTYLGTRADATLEDAKLTTALDGGAPTPSTTVTPTTAPDDDENNNGGNNNGGNNNGGNNNGGNNNGGNNNGGNNNGGNNNGGNHGCRGRRC